MNRQGRSPATPLACGAAVADQVGGEVERDGGRQAEHDQQDDEPDAQQVVAELLGGDDPPAGARDAAFASRSGASLDGGLGGDGRGAHCGLRRAALRSVDFRFSPAGLTGGRSTALR